MMTLFDFLLNSFEGDDCYALFDMNRGSHCSLAQDTAADPKKNLCGLRGKKPCHCNDMKKLTCNFTFVRWLYCLGTTFCLVCCRCRVESAQGLFKQFAQLTTICYQLQWKNSLSDKKCSLNVLGWTTAGPRVKRVQVGATTPTKCLCIQQVIVALREGFFLLIIE